MRYARLRSAVAILPFAGPLGAAAPAGAPAPDAPRKPDEPETTVSELVVTASAPQAGGVVGDVPAELQLDPDDIQAYGLSSVAELLAQLSPQTRTERGRGGAPVVLVNGRRIAGFAEIRDLPTEAIQRVDVLPEEAALKYGYPATQRVINFVLKREFRASTVELTARAPTAGGRVDGEAELGYFRIDGDRRVSLDLEVRGATALTEAERGLSGLVSGRLFDPIGNVRGLLPDGQIDPALSALAGSRVTVAGVPASAATRAPTLAEFAAGAGRPNQTDVGRFRTLLPETRTATLNAVFSTPLTEIFSGSLNATLEATDNDSRLGLPGATLTVPAGHPASPFIQPVALDRHITALGPLTQSRESWTGRLGGGLNGDVARWRLSITGAYEREETQIEGDAALNVAPLQAQVTARAPGLNPFGALPADLLAFRTNDTRATSDNANLQGVASGELLRVPAGALRASLRAGATYLAFDSRAERLGVTQTTDLSRTAYNGQASLDLPLASTRAGFLPELGELSVNLNLAAEDLSDFGMLTTLGYGLNWRPITRFSLIASMNHDDNAPTVRQLGDPSVFTPGVRIFDFATGRTVDVVRVSGGNANLRAETRETLRLGVNWSPIEGHDLVLSANYVGARTKNPVVTFPAATADIEAAFPGRFTRDASGALVQVDYRPINFSRAERRSLRSGLNYSRPIGPQPPARGRPGPGGRPGGSSGMTPGGGGPPSFASGGPPPSAMMGMRGGPGGGAGPGGRLQASLYHTLIFEDRYLIRPGGPVLDRLDGAATDGANGGQPRHEIEAEVGGSLRGLGARLSVNWVSGTTVRGGPGSAVGDLDFSSLTKVDLRFFADLDQRKDITGPAPWLKGTRVSLGVANLFNQRIRVRDAAGATPTGYQPANLDALGRTVRFSVRKLL
jgi:hypothetical protein